MNSLVSAVRPLGVAVGTASLVVAELLARVLPQRYPRDGYAYGPGAGEDGLYPAEAPDRRTRH